jgi:hypothetical protein
LLQPQLLCSHLLPAAQGLTACGRLVGQPALHCLANLAQLLTGCSAKAHDSQPQNNHHQQQLLVVQPSRALEVADVAAAYCLTATHLLAAAASSPTPRKQQQRHKQQHKQPQQQLLFGDCASDGAAIGAHVLLESGCWMLGSQPHLLQLQRVLCTAQPEAGMPLWCAYVVHLLQDGRAITSSGSATGNLHASNVQRGLADAVLNVLAFAPGLLLLMWRWLAVTAGLPLEAPLQASRGLDVAAVSGGPAALDSGVALVMGVFCRWVHSCAVVLCCFVLLDIMCTRVQGNTAAECSNHTGGVHLLNNQLLHVSLFFDPCVTCMRYSSLCAFCCALQSAGAAVAGAG